MIYDVAIIGLGPAGIEFAKESLKFGLKTIAFEKSSVGGTCLNLGCIPTKTMLSCAEVFSKISNFSKYGILSAQDEFNYSYSQMRAKKNKIVEKLSDALKKDLLNKGLTIISSAAELCIENNCALIVSDNKEYRAKKIIAASGSKPLDIDIDCQKDVLLNSDDLLSLTELPKNILIIGSGAIGIEWARIFASLGVNVCVVEKAKSLAPQCDKDISARIERFFKISKVKFFKDCIVLAHNNGVATLSNGSEIICDKILCAAGRAKVLPKIINNFNLQILNNCKTNIDNLFVTGDAVGGIMLAHAASFQARSLFNSIYKNKEYSISDIPSVIYGSPEIASIGIKEQEIDDLSLYKIYKLPISYLPKAWCDDEIDGFIKIITKDGYIKGAHIVSKEASALICQIAIAMKANMRTDDLLEVVFPHPTYSEGIYEALNYAD